MNRGTYSILLVFACAFGMLLLLVNGIAVLNSWFTGNNVLRRDGDLAATALAVLGLAIVVTTVVLFARRRGANVPGWFRES